MSELSIRRYQPPDRERVLELHVEPMEDVGAFVDDGPTDLDADMRDIPAAYGSAGGTFLVGELDGEIVGMGGFRPPSDYVSHFLGPLTDGTAEVQRMRVDGAYQGRGFGDQLLTEIERRARDHGFTELVLDTTPKQTAAMGLYEKHGFEIACREDVTLDGETVTMIFYRTSLE